MSPSKRKFTMTGSRKINFREAFGGKFNVETAGGIDPGDWDSMSTKHSGLHSPSVNLRPVARHECRVLKLLWDAYKFIKGNLVREGDNGFNTIFGAFQRERSVEHFHEVQSSELANQDS